MSKVLDKFARAALRRSGLRPLQQRLRHRGLFIDVRANLEITGRFRYGVGCVISEGANIIVPEAATFVLGEHCYVGRYAEIGPGACISIGSDTSIQDRCILVGDVTVGRHCLVSLNVLISSGRHYFDLRPTWLIRDQDRLAASDRELAAQHSRPVRVDDDCWLGMNSVIMPGVTVGKGAVIGAGSIVTRDVPPYTVVAGSPAREIKKRLVFTPPKRIHFANPGDWPYFYSGFDLTQSSMPRNAERGGVVADDTFAIRLDTAGARTVRLVASSFDASRCELHFGEQRVTLDGDFREVEFRLDEIALSSGVQVSIEPKAARVLVKEARVE